MIRIPKIRLKKVIKFSAKIEEDGSDNPCNPYSRLVVELPKEQVKFKEGDEVEVFLEERDNA